MRDIREIYRAGVRGKEIVEQILPLQPEGDGDIPVCLS